MVMEKVVRDPEEALLMESLKILEATLEEVPRLATKMVMDLPHPPIKIVSRFPRKSAGMNQENPAILFPSRFQGRTA